MLKQYDASRAHYASMPAERAPACLVSSLSVCLSVCLSICLCRRGTLCDVNISHLLYAANSSTVCLLTMSRARARAHTHTHTCVFIGRFGFVGVLAR